MSTQWAAADESQAESCAGAWPLPADFMHVDRAPPKGVAALHYLVVAACILLKKAACICLAKIH